MKEPTDKNQAPKKRRGIKPWFYVVSLVTVAVVSVGGTLALTEDSQGGAPSVISALPTALSETYAILKEGYIEEVSDETLIEGAIAGMAASVEDPYTEYLDEVETDSLDESLSGTFEGIGAEVMKDGEYVKIVSPISNSPAEEVGLQPNDIITHIDDESIAGLTLTESVNLIRGPKGSEVTLTISRGDRTFDVTITRDSVAVETVIYEVDADHADIGHIRLTDFSTPTYDELIAAIEDLESQGVNKIIFDVRGNPGGLLTSVRAISNIFVPDGKPLMEVEYGTDGEKETYLADSEEYGDFKYKGEAVLLIDEGSASASEILAGAMSSVDIPLIGTTTFGKGTVQSVIPLSSTGELKFTSAKWLTAEGEWINEIGIAPDIEVEMPEYKDLLYIDPAEIYQAGDSSVETENINFVLQALGYEVADSQLYSEETQAAVEEFQTKHGLTVDGVVTGDTAQKLVEELRALIEANDTQYERAIDYLTDES